jgi:farnesol dehydrogenase
MNGVTLVTGATGYIGSHVASQLVAARADVRVLVRRPERLPLALRGQVEVRVGDVRDAAVLEHAARGARAILHLAACARAWTRDPREFDAVNVAGVRNVLEAARAAGVERLVHVATVLTLPPFRRPGPARPRRPTPYEQSKLEGERLVEGYAAEGRHAVIVHPTRVFGPGPLTEANALTRVVAQYLAGRFRVRLADGDALGNYVHVADVAAGIRQAAERGRPAAHYLLGGENASFREFLDLVAEVSGVRRHVVPLPRRLAVTAAGAAEVWGWLGGAAPITRDWVETLLEDRRGDVGAARADLGYEPRPLRQGIAETIAWLRSRRAAA